MNFPAELLYTKSHEWVKKISENTVEIGLTDYAQDALGDLVFVNLPEIDDQVTIGESFGDVESVKAVSDMYSPVTGKVCEINEDIMDSPESINSSPYTSWFIRVEDVEEMEETMDAEQYESFVQSL